MICCGIEVWKYRGMEILERLSKSKFRSSFKLKQKDIDFARRLKAMNVMTVEQIAKATGLTAAEINTL